MAVNIDWSLARSQPNALAAGLGGYMDGQQMAQQQQRQNAFLQAQALEQQRAGVQFTQGQQDRTRRLEVQEREEQRETLKLAGQLLQGVTTPEQWEAAKSNPQLTELIPDIATAPWEQVQQLRDIGIRMQPGFSMAGGTSRYDAAGNLIATAPIDPSVLAYREAQTEATAALVPQRAASAEAARARAAKTRSGGSGGGGMKLPSGFILD